MAEVPGDSGTGRNASLEHAGVRAAMARLDTSELEASGGESYKAIAIGATQIKF